ncbi:frataxin, mitochondrial-like [Silene latifolia]|uniref:frataxin, mitochondrial-like n=1 Tax=Silene latifolia TaxID=37657 RepID=UPI003D7849DD
MHHLRRVSATLNRQILPFRTFWNLLELSSSTSSTPSFPSYSIVPEPSRTFCSRPSDVADVQSPAAIDYRCLLQENEFHKLADSTIHHLLEKLEEYGDNVDIDGFDVDYGNEVLTLKLGNLGTYVVNKQTPNRQIWLSSPVSGPSRFDWDGSSQAWVYRRNKANLFSVLERELEKLCGESVSLS